MKSSITRTSNQDTNLKSFNSLNIKTKSSTASNGNNSSGVHNGTNGTNGGVLTESNNKVRNSANLQHRHSNPTGTTSHLTNAGLSSAKSRVLPNSNSISDNNNPANALPRIRINS